MQCHFHIRDTNQRVQALAGTLGEALNLKIKATSFPSFHKESIRLSFSNIGEHMNGPKE